MTAERLSPEQARWVEDAAPRVHQIARTLAPRMPHTSHDELVSAGYEGLVQAALRYQPESGVPFVAFAHYRVRGAMIDSARRAAPELRRRSRAMKALQATQDLLERTAGAQPAAHVTDPRSLSDRVAAAIDLVRQATTAVLVSRAAPKDPDGVIDELGEDAETMLLHRELRAGLQEVLAKADARERGMIEALYFEGATMQEYADRVGKNKSTVSRHHARLLQTLGIRLRRRMAGG